MYRKCLKGMFSPQSGDYVTAVDESSLILIKSVESTTTPETLHELAETIVAMMNAEAIAGCKGCLWHRGTGTEGCLQVLQGSLRWHWM